MSAPEPSGPTIMRGGIPWPVEPEMKAAFEQSREWAQAAHAEVVGLIRHLYVDLGQDAGGPLHIILDDGNVADHWLRDDHDRYGYLSDGTFERYSEADQDISYQRKRAIRDTCEQILTLLRPMTEQQRRDAINEFWKGRTDV